MAPPGVKLGADLIDASAVPDGVGVRVEVGVTVGVGNAVGVLIGSGVLVKVGMGTKVGVRVTIGVAVAVRVRALPGVDVAITAMAGSVSVTVGVVVAVKVGVLVSVGSGVGVAVGGEVHQGAVNVNPSKTQVRFPPPLQSVWKTFNCRPAWKSVP